METRFRPVSLGEKEKYYRVWDMTPRHSLDYTLANLWGWQEYYGLEWQFEDNLCWVRQTKPENSWWAPLGDWNGVNWNEFFHSGSGVKPEDFIRVPKELLQVWQIQMGGQVVASEERGQWEYLYLQEELASLPGNRFHKKRNHYNSYVKTYGEPDYRNITDQMVEDVLKVQDDWCQWHECDDSPSLSAENEAVNRVLAHWDNFRSLVGGSLYVENRMIAFAVGEKLDSETLGVHFEKGLNGYKGIYQAMNLEFAKRAGAGLKWINRAQDLDEEGLRQAKMTYLPSAFLEKFRVRLELCPIENRQMS